MRDRRTRKDLRVGLLALAQHDQEGHRAQHEHRQQQKQQQRHADGIQHLADLPAGRRRFGRRERQPSVALFGGDVVQQRGARRLWRRVRGVLRQPRPQGLMQRGFLADLKDRASDPVDVEGGGRDEARLHPGEEVGGVVVVLAMGKNRPQPRFRQRDELGKLRLGGAVALTKEREGDRQRHGRRATGHPIRERRVVQHHQARKVQPLEPAEREQRVVRIGDARRLRHPA